MERHRIELYRARDRYSVKLRMLGDDHCMRKPWPSSMEKTTSGFTSSNISARGNLSSGSLQSKKMEAKAQVSSHGLQRKDALSGSDSQHMNQSSLSVIRKKRVHQQVGDIEDPFLHKVHFESLSSGGAQLTNHVCL